MRKVVPAALCLLLLVGAGGCALLVVGAAAGAGGMAYVRGALEARVNAQPPAVAQATENAFKSLGIVKISGAASALDAEILGRTATDKKVKVVVKGEGAGTSKLTIRIGTFGDETMSRAVFDKIEEGLIAGRK